MEHQDIKHIFRERFDKLRADRSNTEFAAFLGISRQTVGFYLNDGRMPDAITLAKIAVRCGVSTDYLLGLTDEATPNVDERAASEYTGLSVKAIKRMRSWAGAGYYADDTGSDNFTADNPLKVCNVLSDFLEHRSAYMAFELLTKAIVLDDMHQRKLDEMGAETATEEELEKAYNILPKGYEILHGKDATRYRYTLAKERLSRVIEFVINERTEHKGG